MVNYQDRKVEETRSKAELIGVPNTEVKIEMESHKYSTARAMSLNKAFPGVREPFSPSGRDVVRQRGYQTMLVFLS